MISISVVIPTFNRASLIVRAINSVLNQTWKNLELIIIDDGSTDNTHSSIHAMKELLARYYKTENRGVAAARNLGVEKATGKWIAFLDSDDSWMPDKLEQQMKHINMNAGARVIYTQERWIRNGVRVNPPERYRKFSGDVFLHCLPVCLIAPSSMLIDKELFISLGGFNESYPVCEDYDFNLRIAGQFNVALVEKELICKYGGHPDQLSTSYPGIDFWRIRAVCGILRNGNYPQQYQPAIYSEIDRKAEIYLTGCVRRGHKDNFQTAYKMIKEVYPDFKFLYNISIKGLTV